MNVLAGLLNRSRWLLFYLRYRGSFASLPPTTIIGRRIRVLTPRGARSIEVGERVTICDGVQLETSESGRIELGAHAWLSRDVVISAHAVVRVGEHSLIGEFSSIRDFDHGMDVSGVPMARQPVKVAAVLLRRDVWLGRGVAVLKGVTIGEGAVVGANAVVTRDIEPNSICVGVPAKPIRKRRS